VSPRKFDRYMVGLGAGRHVKFRRLTIPERYAFFMGVLSLAAQSPVRGCLMIGSLAVEPADVAAEADVPEKVAASAMEKLRAVEVIIRDEHGLEWVHDFQDWNPEPKTDNTSAERQQRYRERMKHKGISRNVSSAVKDAVMERDDGRCVQCGTENNLEFHHRTPVLSGGDNSASNIELRCFDCHRGHAGHGSSRVTSRPVTHDGDAEVTPAEVKREVEEEENKAATPLRGARPGTVSRSLAETVACPRCGVAPGEKCDGVRAKRESCHLERHHAVGELLDLPKVSPSHAKWVFDAAPPCQHDSDCSGSTATTTRT
jgi:5-methylcytosine-specific restriction endonuclease McrA